jgi:hypothetical protein
MLQSERDSEHIERWYDRYTKCWVVQLKDGKGNQIGEAIYVHSKAEATRVERNDFQP